jgi:WD40 repeat protein
LNPNGRLLISGGNDQTLRIWDLESGECLRILKGHTNDITCVSVTPDGRWAVSGSRDRTLRVWDLATGRCLRILEGHHDGIVRLCVSPDGRRVVSASRDKTLRVWDLESGRSLHTLKGHREKISSVSISTDGQWIVSASGHEWKCWDNTLRIWDLESAQCLANYDAGSAVRSAAMTAGGNRIIAGCSDGQVHFLTPVNFPPAGPAILTAMNAKHARCPCCGLEFSPDPQVISAIQGNSEMAPPDSLFADSRLDSVCPHCARPLKFNPYLSNTEDYTDVLRRGLESIRRGKGHAKFRFSCASYRVDSTT